jgi:RNA polymerase sigma factor (sigma-70 family)
MYAIAMRHSPHMANDGMETIDAGLIEQLSRYCRTCWKNARIHAQYWHDATQKVFVRLLERVHRRDWPSMLSQTDTPARKEFTRAIDTIRQQYIRMRGSAELSGDLPDRKASIDAARREMWSIVQDLLYLLSPRQRKIVEFTRLGYVSDEIANELDTNTDRVQDEKSKALKKLRRAIKEMGLGLQKA